jgi:hypothetical protein
LANLGATGETQSPRESSQSVMPSGNENLQRKDRLLAKLDPEHEVELDEDFIGPLAAAIRASSPDERQQALDNAIEAYEHALDDALYENGEILLRKAAHDARRAQNS